MTLVYLNVGSNIERTVHIKAGLEALHARFGKLALSSVYESEALGFKGRRFYNLAVALHTTMPVADLQAWLRQLEYTWGREPDAERFSPRTLDIDILNYGNAVGTVSGVELPRPEILENAHVLGPLAELAPEAVHPIVGQNYARLWADYGGHYKIWPVDFDWRGERISWAED